MGLFSGLLGHASEITEQQLEKSIGPILAESETIVGAYRLVRDRFIFTNRRLILVDKQGLTGKKREILSIPFAKVTKWMIKTAGHFDVDSELLIWIQNEPEPIAHELKGDLDIAGLNRQLAQAVLFPKA